MILFARSPKSKSPHHKYILNDLNKLFINSSVLENKVSFKNIREVTDMNECNYIFYLKNNELIISSSDFNLLKFKILKIETIEHLKTPFNCSSKGQFLFFSYEVPEKISSLFSSIINAHNSINKENPIDKVFSLINFNNKLFLRINNIEGNEIGPRLLLETELETQL